MMRELVMRRRRVGTHENNYKLFVRAEINLTNVTADGLS